jgi:hypothetical protein
MQPGGKKYWFPAKKYGWGWGPPTCWQGWTAMGVWFVLLLIGEVTLLTHLLAVVLYAILLAIILSFVCYLKGEPPRWRWGK